MCGIAGCVGHHNAVGFVTEGLEVMDYRGYDSAGVAYIGPNLPRLEVVKAVGAVANLVAEIPQDAYEATTAIGHTRWATHGSPRELRNSHPHVSSDETIAVVHNGVIENYASLRDRLKAEGLEFYSQTDTEVVPKLLEYYIAQGCQPDEAFKRAMLELHGANAVVASFGIEPDAIYAANLEGQMVLGVYGDNQRFVASDERMLTAAKIGYQNPLHESEMARLAPGSDGYRIWNLLDGQDMSRPPEEVTDSFEIPDKGEFPHFMLKEIYEAPQVISNAVAGRVRLDRGVVKLGGLESPEIEPLLSRTNRIVIVACGTSLHAGQIGVKLFNEVAGIPAEAHHASEWQYENSPLDLNTTVLAISQSGSTADTLGALKKAKKEGLLRLGINNTPRSQMDRETDAGVHCRADTEVSVASTKALISQVTVLIEMALALSRKEDSSHRRLMEELVGLPEKAEAVLAIAPAIHEIAKRYAHVEHFLYIGRGYEEVSAREGALKLKEISYIHAEAYPAGEMKHGPIALIDENFPTFAIATDSPVYEKTISNIQEIKARGGPVIALVTEGNESIREIVDDVIEVPATLEQTQPILNAIAMQLFAYYMAVERGLADKIDKPRNLAKSVTVE